MRKQYNLLVDDNWETAQLTKKDYNIIIESLQGIYGKQYLIKLNNNDIVDVGIIDDIKIA